MRFMPPIIVALFVAALSAAPAAAQEAGEQLTLTGCLAQDTTEMGSDFVLEKVASDEIDAAKVPLVPVEGVEMAPHVGHEVEVSGVVAVEPKDGGIAEEQTFAPRGDWTLRVMELTHIAASCSESGLH